MENRGNRRHSFCGHGPSNMSLWSWAMPRFEDEGGSGLRNPGRSLRGHFLGQVA